LAADTKVLSKPAATIDSLKFNENIKDCKATTIYEIVANKEFDDTAKKFKYELNTDDLTRLDTFMDNFKQIIAYIIEIVCESVYTLKDSDSFTIIVKDLHDAIKNADSDITKLYAAMKDAFVNAGGVGTELDEVYSNIDFSNEEASKKIGTDFIAMLQNPDAVYKLDDSKLKIASAPKPGVSIDELKFNENVKDCTASNIYSLAETDKFDNADPNKIFKYELSATE